MLRELDLDRLEEIDGLFIPTLKCYIPSDARPLHTTSVESVEQGWALLVEGIVVLHERLARQSNVLLLRCGRILRGGR